jgi:hypothetical protein
MAGAKSLMNSLVASVGWLSMSLVEKYTLNSRPLLGLIDADVRGTSGDTHHPSEK